MDLYPPVPIVRRMNNGRPSSGLTPRPPTLAVDRTVGFGCGTAALTEPLPQSSDTGTSLPVFAGAASPLILSPSPHIAMCPSCTMVFALWSSLCGHHPCVAVAAVTVASVTVAFVTVASVTVAVFSAASRIGPIGLRYIATPDRVPC